MPATSADGHIHLTLEERDALRVRYRQERDKRLRPDGNDQYIELKGQFARLLEDPYTARLERPAKHDDVSMTFIGGGFAGLSAAVDLVEQNHLRRRHRTELSHQLPG